uniref:recombinase family protein n=1 Tax=Streptomyces sp. TG1A-60 TaxID=3129111 RepID=UPI00403FD7B2
MRAAVYVRLSRETDETTSPERQRAVCEALCEARGWGVIAVEEDIDISGFSRGHRPARTAAHPDQARTARWSSLA